MLYQNKEISILMKLGTTLTVAVALLLLWIFFAKLDVIAQTNGQLVPHGQIKTIQVAETSRIQKILVKEGDIVKSGQVVAQLDALEINKDTQALDDEANINDLILRRIDDELGIKPFYKRDGDDPIVFSQIQSELLSRKASYKSSLSELNSSLLQARSELLANQTELSKQEQSIDIWNKQINSYKQMRKLGYISEVAADEKIREAQDKIKDISIQKQRVFISEAKVNEIQNRIERTKQEYITNLLQEKTDIINRQNKTIPALEKAKHKLTLTQLISPVDGIIKDLSTHTEQAVLTPGNILMTVVPENAKLQAEVIVKNEDIGYLKIGQNVKIKVASFPFQKYGLVPAKVIYISADAITQKENTNPSDPTNSGYKVALELKKEYLGTSDKPYFLKSGMKIEADIKISERTVFEYLISPLKQVKYEAARER